MLNIFRLIIFYILLQEFNRKILYLQGSGAKSHKVLYQALQKFNKLLRNMKETCVQNFNIMTQKQLIL